MTEQESLKEFKKKVEDAMREPERRRFRSIMLTVSGFIAIVAGALAIYFYGWKLAVILVLFLWSNNISEKYK